jgi:hypothetical protein
LPLLSGAAVTPHNTTENKKGVFTMKRKFIIGLMVSLFLVIVSGCGSSRYPEIFVVAPLSEWNYIEGYNALRMTFVLTPEGWRIDNVEYCNL